MNTAEGDEPALQENPTAAPGPTHAPTPPVPTPAATGPSRTPLFEAMNASRYGRQALIKEIEKTAGATLICYVSPRRQIDRDDVIGMVDLLHNIPSGQPIDLLLHSPGGDIDAAEKLITLVRKRAAGAPLRVVVPDYAKSAATLMALGANQILMSDSSELGAIDPQAEVLDSKGHAQTLSARCYIDAYHEHADRLATSPDDQVARLMLAKIEPGTVRKLERMIQRSQSIAEDLLSTMIKDPAEAAAIAKELSNTDRWQSHGQMISHEHAHRLGLNIGYLAPNDTLWRMYWRLFCLQLWATTEGESTLFESAYASLPIV